MSDQHLGEDLPFTEEEFYRAFRLVESEAGAREAASYTAALVRDTAALVDAARQARERGETDPSVIAEPTWYIGDEAFALLGLVSDDLRERVDAYMNARWEGERPAITRAALHRHGRLITGDPTDAERADVDAEIASYRAAWTQLRRRVERRVRRSRRARNDRPPASVPSRARSALQRRRPRLRFPGILRIPPHIRGRQSCRPGAFSPEESR